MDDLTWIRHGGARHRGRRPDLQADQMAGKAVYAKAWNKLEYLDQSVDNEHD